MDFDGYLEKVRSVKSKAELKDVVFEIDSKFRDGSLVMVEGDWVELERFVRVEILPKFRV